ASAAGGVQPVPEAPLAALDPLRRRLPRHAAAGEVGQRVNVLGLVDVAGRGGEAGVRLEPDYPPGLFPAHPLDIGKLGGRHLLTGHQVDDAAHDVDGLVEVLFHGGVAVDVQVGKGPLLIKHAQADL